MTLIQTVESTQDPLSPPDPPPSPTPVEDTYYDPQLVAFAKRELELLAASVDPRDRENQQRANEVILKLVETVCRTEQPRIGRFAMLDTARKLCNYETLTPLTGDADEWQEMTDGSFQSLRCASVFRQVIVTNGVPSFWDYDLDAKRHVYPDDFPVPGKSTLSTITFPYFHQQVRYEYPFDEHHHPFYEYIRTLEIKVDEEMKKQEYAVLHLPDPI